MAASNGKLTIFIKTFKELNTALVVMDGTELEILNCLQDSMTTLQ